MKKELPEWMIEDHKRWKEKWVNSGSKLDFYEWLLDNVERGLKEQSKCTI